MPDPMPNELMEDAFRTSLFVYMNPNVDAAEKLNDLKDNLLIDKYNGRHIVKMTMPDGDVEYWREVNSEHDYETGFKAMAFEQCEADGSTYLNPATGGPETMVIFPGSTFSSQDLKRSNMIARGDSMVDYFEQVDEFSERVIKNMQIRADQGGYNTGNVTIGTHSLGATCVNAPLRFRECGMNNVDTVMIEPVGAAQSLQQASKYEAMKRYSTINPTMEQMESVADDMERDVVSLRSDDDNMFHGKGGDQLYDNNMIGDTYRFYTADGFGDDMTDHLARNVADALLFKGADGIFRTPEEDISVQDVLDGGRDLSFGEKVWAQTKSGVFDDVGNLTSPFNAKAAWRLDENPASTTPRPNFEGIGKPGYMPDPEINGKIAGPQLAAPDERFKDLPPPFMIEEPSQTPDVKQTAQLQL